MTKTTIRSAAAAALILTLAAGPSAAHHSTAMFDSSTEVELTGVVKEFQYTNPHAWLIVDVETEDGETETWGFELDGPTTLMRARIGKNTFPEGETVTVRGNPHVDGRNAAGWTATTLADGTVITPRGRQ